jgi:cytochrome c oxidase assembly factor 6
MGWFSSSPSPAEPPSREASIQTGAAVPTRAERQRCWASRDLLFACLDRNAIVDATAPPGSDLAEKVCAPELRGMERDCAAEWVKYFKTWRVAEIRKKERLDELKKQGAVEMEVTSRFKG